MRRGFHLLVRLSAGLVALVVVALSLLAARLAAGPMSLTFLVPTLARVIEATTPLRLDKADVHLIWRDWQAGLLLQLGDVHVRAGEDARGQIDAFAISFSPQAILDGVVAPSVVIARGGELTLVRNADGTLALPAGIGLAGSTPSAPGTFDTGPAPTAAHAPGPLTFLRDVDVRDVTVHVDDRSIGSDWTVRLDRAYATREHGLLKGEGALALTFAGQQATLQAAIAEVAEGSGTLQADLQLGAVRPAVLAPLLGSPAPLMALDLPLSGPVTLEITADGTIASADAALAGGEGALILTPALAQAAGMPAVEQRLAVRSLVLQGAYAASGPDIDLRNLEVTFAPGAEIRLPPPIDQPYPLAAIGATGRYQNGRLELTPLTLDVGGPQLTATAALDNVTDAPSGTVEVTATRVFINDLRRLWPSKMAPGGYVWVTEHLHDGMVPRATARVQLTSHDGVTNVSNLSADFDVQGLTVDYREPMPVVRNVRGRAKADLTSLVITIDGGQAAGLSVHNGTITLLNLDRDVPNIDIDVDIAGPVRSAMALVSSAPIDFPRDIVHPEQFSGTQSTSLRMSFPLLDDLDTADIKLLVETDVQDLGVADIIPGVDVTDGHLRLHLDTETLMVRGPVAVGGIFGLLDWQQALDSHADPQTQAEFIVENAPVARLKHHLQPMVDVDEYLLGGTFDALLRARLGAHGTGRIEGTFDLGATTVALPELNWRKDAGHPATLDVEARIENDKSISIPRVHLTAPKLIADGGIKLNDEGELDHVDVRELKMGRTALSATVSRLPQGGWDVLLMGDTLDLAPLLEQAERSGSDSATSLGSVPKLTLAADLGKVWLQSPDPISDARATIVHEHGVWSLVQMQGTLKPGSTVELLVEPDASGNGRSLTLEADNAGEALRFFGLSPDVVGGWIRAEGRFDDADPDHPLAGRLRVRAFHLTNAPILARMLNLMSLTGIGDALTGRGIYFTALDLPFSERQRTIGIYNGRAFGAMLGVTGTGTINLNAGLVDMQGQLVPFYAVNALFGRIPLLGPVLTGGEEGGGLISASYQVTGTLDNPQPRVNPVSVLFPGFVRWILETVQGWLGIGNNPVSEAVLGGNWP